MPTSKPNIIYVLADDMGYGDLSCLNPDSKIRTTHLDRLAGGGMACRDAHASSAVCTPSLKDDRFKRLYEEERQLEEKRQ